MSSERPERRDTRRDRVHLGLADISFEMAYGGGSKRFRGYLPGLKQRGIDVTVFTSTPTRVKARIAGLDERAWASVPIGAELPAERSADAAVRRVHLPHVNTRRRRALYIRWMFRRLRRMPHRPDVVQLLSASLEQAPWLRKFRAEHVPLALAGTMLPETGGGRLRQRGARLVRGMPLRYIDCAIASSATMESDFRSMGFTGRVAVIPNGVDLARFRPARSRREKSKARDALGIPTHHHVLLFVGGVSPRKGVDFLLEAWRELLQQQDDVHLIIVGPRRDLHDPTCDSFRRRLTEIAGGKSFSDRLHFTGIVDNPEDYMRSADVFTFMSQREGMANVILEAMATGLPVLMTPFIGLLPEFGRQGVEYSLVERRPEKVADVIQRLLADPDRRATMGQAARAWVARTMDVEASLDEYAEVYRSLACPGLRPGMRIRV